MCLYKTHWLPKISRKPIQVYKIFYTFGDNELITPHQQKVYIVGETIKAKHSWLKSIFKNGIYGEGVHAYVYKDKAKEVMYSFIYGAVVHLCEIPPFTPYWIGKNGDIAASKMIIKEKVQL